MNKSSQETTIVLHKYFPKENNVSAVTSVSSDDVDSLSSLLLDNGTASTAEIQYEFKDENVKNTAQRLFGSGGV